MEASPLIPPEFVARVTALYHYSRLQLPTLPLRESDFFVHLERTFQLYVRKSVGTPHWNEYLDGLYLLDWLIAAGCLEGLEIAWELLFNARTGRSDCLLIDALRSRACRLYPRDEERQEGAVTEFWSLLIVPETDGGSSVLSRYDGIRPLAPWLIRVFQNLHVSKLRSRSGTTALPDDDFAEALPTVGESTERRWHESFRNAAHEWLATVTESERLILGLRWRYRMSQREVAQLLGVHEGTVSRQLDKIRERAIDEIGLRLTNDGWTGDDLEGFIHSEMGTILLDAPGLSADSLTQLLAARGKSVA